MAAPRGAIVESNLRAERKMILVALGITAFSIRRDGALVAHASLLLSMQAALWHEYHFASGGLRTAHDGTPQQVCF